MSVYRPVPAPRPLLTDWQRYKRSWVWIAGLADYCWARRWAGGAWATVACRVDPDSRPWYPWALFLDDWSPVDAAPHADCCEGCESW